MYECTGRVSALRPGHSYLVQEPALLGITVLGAACMLGDLMPVRADARWISYSTNQKVINTVVKCCDQCTNQRSTADQRPQCARVETSTMKQAADLSICR